MRYPTDNGRMSFQINTNLSATIASNNANLALSNSSTSLERISTGRQINSSKDDAAGIAISAKLASEVSKKQNVAQNLQNSLSFLQVQQSYISQASNLISRASTLKHRFHAVTTNEGDKQHYDNEFREIQLQLREMQGQKFNGVSLFAGGNIGSLASAADHESILTVKNPANDQVIELHRTGIFDSLFFERSPARSSDENPFVFGDGSESTTNFVASGKSGTIEWKLDSFGAPDRFTIMQGNEVLFDEIYGNANEDRTFGDGTTMNPAGGIDPDSPVELDFAINASNPSANLKFIVNKGNQLDPDDPSQINANTVYGSTITINYNTYEASLTDGTIYSLNDFTFSEFNGFIDVMSDAIAQNGASQNRILNETHDLYTSYENIELAESRIVDADYALESTRLARSNLLAQSSAKMIGEANNLTKLALTIMGQQSL